MDCRGCVHEGDKKQMQTGYFAWHCTQPHPCTLCARYTAREDNYTPAPDDYEISDSAGLEQE